MKNTFGLFRKVEEALSEASYHSMSLEKKNADLKAVVRIFGRAMNIDQEGNTTINITQEDADFIRKVAEDCNVFNTKSNDILTGGNNNETT